MCVHLHISVSINTTLTKLPQFHILEMGVTGLIVVVCNCAHPDDGPVTLETCRGLYVYYNIIVIIRKCVRFFVYIVAVISHCREWKSLRQ